MNWIFATFLLIGTLTGTLAATTTPVTTTTISHIKAKFMAQSLLNKEYFKKWSPPKEKIEIQTKDVKPELPTLPPIRPIIAHLPDHLSRAALRREVYDSPEIVSIPFAPEFIY